MKYSREMILFAAAIGLVNAANRWWWKWITVHRIWETLIAWIIAVIISIVWIRYAKIPFNGEMMQTNLWYILIPAIWWILAKTLAIIWFQKWFPVSSFPLIYWLFALLFTVILWVLFYKEVITIKQSVGLVFALVAMILLK
jgi:uncharacterized membrane protein